MMRILLGLLLSIWASIASAQIVMNPCVQIPGTTANPNYNCQQVTEAYALPVTGNTAVPTYAGAATGVALTVAGDIYCVQGSATKTIKVKGVRFSAIATAAANVDVTIVLRSTLDTGGTPTSVSLVPEDPLNAAATATVVSFSGAGAPTPGTAIGTIRSQKTVAGSTTVNSAVGASPALFQFSVYWDQPVTLRGATQAMCVNVSAIGAGASADIDHEHTEEPNGY